MGNRIARIQCWRYRHRQGFIGHRLRCIYRPGEQYRRFGPHVRTFMDEQEYSSVQGFAGWPGSQRYGP